MKKHTGGYPKIDYSGQIFDDIKVIKSISPTIKLNGTISYERWECECPFGHKIVYASTSLRSKSKKRCIICKYPDITGIKHNEWTPLEKLGRVRNKQRWKCQCSCGNIREVILTDLLKGISKSCGECYNKYEFCHEYYCRIKDLANRRNINFELTFIDLWNLFLKQNRKCALSGQDINFMSAHFMRKNKIEQTSSLDRINNNLGYTIENVQFVHKDVNWIKHKLNETFFIDMCMKIHNYQKYQWAKHQSIISDKKYFNINFKRIKNAAFKFKKPFNVSKKFLLKLFLKQGGICPISGLPICFKEIKTKQQTASLDRIDSKFGYNKKNVQWVHKIVNLMKLDFEQQYFIDLCCKVAETEYNKLYLYGGKLKRRKS